MRFDNSELPTSEAELASVETLLGFKLFPSLRQQYLAANGGSPTPYVYEDDNLDTVVSSFLPISSAKGQRTAVDTYVHLVRIKQIVPFNYFPFAVDGGGDYFFVDCGSDDGAVLFFRSDVTTAAGCSPESTSGDPTGAGGASGDGGGGASGDGAAGSRAGASGMGGMSGMAGALGTGGGGLGIGTARLACWR